MSGTTIGSFFVILIILMMLGAVALAALTEWEAWRDSPRRRRR